MLIPYSGATGVLVGQTACLTAPSQPHGLINSHFVLGFKVACDYFIVSQAKEYCRMLPGEIQDFEFGFQRDGKFFVSV